MTLAAPPLPPALAGWSPASVDASAVRAAARALRETADDHAIAVRRLDRTAAALADRWTGDAGRSAVARLHALRGEVSALSSAHDDAAAVLDVCARKVDEAHATWRRAQALDGQDAAERASRRTAPGFVGPYEVDDSPVRRQARRLAQEAHDTAAVAAARAAQALDDLAGHLPRTSPDTRRPLTVAQQLAGVATGAVDATWETLVGAAELSTARLYVDPSGWLDHVRALGDGLQQAAQDPWTAVDLALDLQKLRDGEYGEWVGGLVPDLVGTVFTGGAVPVGRRTAELADDLAELGEDVQDLQRVVERAGAGGPVELRDGVDAPDGYVPFVENLSDERRTHILDGDTPKKPGGKPSGGHRAGTGNLGKTEFPPDWDDETIIRIVMETARRPQTVELQGNGKYRVTAQHDGVTVEVIVTKDGRVWTAYPLPGGRGVVKNSGG